MDGYFDFAQKVLATQRRSRGVCVSASVKAGETVHEQVTKATETVTAQTVNGTERRPRQADRDRRQKAAATARAARNATKA